MSQMRDEDRYLFAFSHVPGIGPARIAALRARFGSAGAAWQAPAGELGGVLGRKSLASLLEVRRSFDIDAALGRLRSSGASILTVDEPSYPPALKSIGSAPFLLYVMGDGSVLSSSSVAMVGARKASEYGRLAAAALAGELAAAGLTIVSGLAHGIDACAHRAALDSGGRSVAVLGCGLDIAYPSRNRALMSDIAHTGAVITEYPLGTPPLASNFPARNRIISGLCLATIVVEASRRSGAMITAQYAADQGRDVFAVPGSIFAESQGGANFLLSTGAGVALSAADILSALDISRPSAAGVVPLPVPADPIEASVLAELGKDPVHIDTVSRKSGRDSAEVARALAMLELRGMVRHTGGMRWVVVR